MPHLVPSTNITERLQHPTTSSKEGKGERKEEKRTEERVRARRNRGQEGHWK